ncbi:MAG: sensor histidine kinase, partial [Spirochaetota bacterium]
MVLVLLTVIFVALVYRNIQKNFYFTQLEREFRTEAYLLSHIFSTAQKPKIVEQWGLKGKPRITVINSKGDVLLETSYNPYRMGNQLSEPEVKKALQDGWGKSVRWSRYIGTKMFFVAEYFQHPGSPEIIIRLALPVYEIRETLNHTTYTIVLGGAFIFIVMSILGLVISREITRPIMVIASYIREFSSGNTSIRLPFFRNRELNLLSSELNRIIENTIMAGKELNMVKDQTVKILASMSEGIVLINTEGIIMRSNRAAEEMFRTKQQGLQGKNLNALIRSDRIKEAVKKITQGASSWYGRVNINIPDTREIDFFCTSLGKQAGIVVVLRDVTRMAKLERVRQEFMANVSHELKTPVTSMKGFVETLLGMDPIDQKALRKFLDIINKNILRMENIIQDLLTLSRIEWGVDALPDTPFDITSCVDDAVNMIRT